MLSQEPSSTFDTVERRSSLSSAPSRVEIATTQPTVHKVSKDTESSLLRASERFGAARAISALLGLCAGPLLMHAFAIDSSRMFGFGIVCVVAAIGIQWKERRRAFKQLVRIARAHGADEASAATQARTTMRKWLS